VCTDLLAVYFIVMTYVMYIYIYIADDPKVLVRSFSCEGCACYVGNPRESFFRVRERNVLLVKVLRKLDIMIHYRCILYTLQLVKGYHLLPPGVRQENGTAP